VHVHKHYMDQSLDRNNEEGKRRSDFQWAKEVLINRPLS
jgi:hypothetical protein